MQKTPQTIVSIATGPLQVRNISAYLSEFERDHSISILLLVLSGEVRWDRQSLLAASEVDCDVFYIVLARKTTRKIVKSFLTWQKEIYFQRRIFGKASLGILFTLIRLNFQGLIWRGERNRLEKVILGNAEDRAISPIERFLGDATRIVVVDDGFLTLRTVELRAKLPSRYNRTRLGWPRRAPYEWKRPFLFFTIFRNISPAPGDSILTNRRFLNVNKNIKIVEEVSWILGSPTVEQKRESLSSYSARIESAVLWSRAHGLVPSYIPHRREAETKVANLCSQLEIDANFFDLSVEDQILATRQCPRAVLGFATTALSILSDLTPDQCSLLLIESHVDEDEKKREQAERIRVYLERDSRIHPLK